ncbi:hypothetical protein ACFQJD_15175 [Haloplanus sp. GCM10025708]|uniref:hypothetical protein n=1 Tax=Haloferacaceae TaxID=1644056 RepID=UPI003621B860
MDDTERDVEALRHRAPGETRSDPYEDVDVSDLPEWWREAVEEFEEHGLRPYRPPRFADGTMKHEVVERLEDELGVSISFVGYNVEFQDDWSLLVDGETVGPVGRHRAMAGYTVYEMDADEFESTVRAFVDD